MVWAFGAAIKYLSMLLTPEQRAEIVARAQASSPELSVDGERAVSSMNREAGLEIDIAHFLRKDDARFFAQAREWILAYEAALAEALASKDGAST